MSWRPTKPSNDDDELDRVLDHYGVQVRGRMAHCPLHTDHTPSMSIDRNKGVWKCHSCNEGGGAWQLILKMEGGDVGRARAVEANLGLSAGTAGGGGDEIPGSAYAGRRGVPRPQRDHRGDRRYRPSWRRK